MKIPEIAYSKQEFIQYLQENSDEVFMEEARRHWLKIYCIHVSDDTWKKTLFSDDEIKVLGDIYKVTLPHTDDEETTYYIVEYAPRLLLLFTSAKTGEYKKTLGSRVKHTRGVTQMWIKPDLFKSFWNMIISSTDGYVYNFRSRRSSSDESYCQLRPYHKRRFNYTGDDAKDVMEEVKELYGVTPDSIRIQVHKYLKIHLTNRGLYSAQRASSEALSLFFDYLDSVLDDIMRIKNVSQAMKFDFVNGSGSLSHLKFPSVVPGLINMSLEMNNEIAEKIIDTASEFSFVDCDIQAGSLKFTATVIDEYKDSVFNISANESEMYLIPKYRTTFDSYINFYEFITENIDKHAELSIND